jgi:hypothetical protein
MGLKIRAWVCFAVAAALGCGTMARAQTVTANLVGLDPFNFGSTLSYNGNLITGGAVAQINWDGTPYNNPVPFNSTFNTFCLDLVDSIGFGQAYSFTIDDDLATAPKASAGGPMGANAALEMQALYGEQFNSLSTTDDLQAFQLAIWSIVYNQFGQVTVNDSSDKFYAISGISANAINEANSWLDEAYNSAVTDTGTFNDNVVALIGLTDPDTGGSVQDQVAIGIIPPSTGVPEINAAGMAPLLILLAGALALRSAKPITTR